MCVDRFKHGICEVWGWKVCNPKWFWLMAIEDVSIAYSSRSWRSFTMRSCSRCEAEGKGKKDIDG